MLYDGGEEEKRVLGTPSENLNVFKTCLSQGFLKKKQPIKIIMKNKIKPISK